MKSVCIYGAGQMGMAVKDFLLAKGMELHYFLDRNEKLNGKELENISVILPEMLQAKMRENDDILVAMAAAPFVTVKKYLLELGYKNIWTAGDYIQKIYPQRQLTNIWTFTPEEVCEALKSGEMFEEQESKRCLEIAVEWFENRGETKTQDYPVDRSKYFPRFIVDSLEANDSMVDMAVLDGAYVKRFMECVEAPQNIWGLSIASSLEAPVAGVKLHMVDGELGEQTGGICRMLLGLMRPFTREVKMERQLIAAEEFLADKEFQYFRAYSMSALLPIFIKGMDAIRRNRPIIAANIGHYKSDFLQLPCYLEQNLTDYLFFFRVHSYQGNDCILYAVPKERGKRIVP